MTDEERIVEEVARALWEADHDRTAWEDATEDGPDEYRRRARAAVAAYRATDGGADALREAVEAVAEEHERAHMSVDPILLRAALAGADGGQ